MKERTGDMEPINLLRVKKISKVLPIYLIFLGLISYSFVKEKGYLYIVIAIFAVSMLLNLVSIFMFYFLKDNDVNKIKACLLFYVSFEFGFVNLWFGLVNDFFLEALILVIMIVLGCVMGFFFLQKKEKRKGERNERNEKKEVALIVISSCLGILGARVLALILNQEIMLFIAKVVLDFLLIIFSFYVGMAIYKLKQVMQ